MLRGQSSNNDITGFYVLTAVTVNSITFWDPTSWRPVDFTDVSEECTTYNLKVEE
jgi:hypothetical protein